VLFIYRWLTEDNPWGLQINKLILAGDSAGGNLALVTAIAAVEQNLPRKPDGLFLAYPAVDLRVDSITPSKVLFVNDVLIPYQALILCHDFYVPKECDAHEDYYCSPLYTPVELLRQLPAEVSIFTAGYDPICDDVIKLIRILENNNIPNNHYHFDCLPHGFLNYGSAIPSATAAKKQSTCILVDIFNRLMEEKTK